MYFGRGRAWGFGETTAAALFPLQSITINPVCAFNALIFIFVVLLKRQSVYGVYLKVLFCIG